MVKLIILALTCAMTQLKGALLPLRRQASVAPPLGLSRSTVSIAQIASPAKQVLETTDPTVVNGDAKLVINKINSQCITPTWTNWFDRDEPTGVGDYQTYVDLKKEGYDVCDNPVDIQCETIDGMSVSSTGDILHFSPSIGCYCKNSEQPGVMCHDYRVKFACCKECAPGVVGVWTNWLNRDQPSGVGDYETLTDFIKAGQPVCSNPIDVECQTVTGIPATVTGENVIVSTSVGCYCKNADQPDQNCDYDYQVRFKCCPECPAGQTSSWTSWLNRDQPSGVGDYETLTDFIKAGEPVCPNPIDVKCQTVNGIPASATGENVIVSASVGCYCKNADQPDQNCDYDYKVRFKCCK